MKTAIFKPVVNYPGNFNTLLEKDISVFFGLCICMNKKKFLSFPCFLRTFVTRPLFSDIHRFIFLVLFCLYFSSCYNLLAELSSLTLSQCLYIFRFSLPYILFCFVSLFFRFYFSFEWCADLVIILYLRKWVSARNHTKNQKEKKTHTHTNRLYCLRVFVWREK